MPSARGDNHAPVVSFSPTSLADINDKNKTSRPFQNVTIADPDGDNVTTTISFPHVRGTLPAIAGFTLTTNGLNAVYTLTARSTNDATTFLRTLAYTPYENRIPLNDPAETTIFTVLHWLHADLRRAQAES